MTGRLLSVAGLWAIAVVVPGPNFLVVARSALEGSREAGLGAVCGIALGTAIWGSAGFLGVTILFAAVPWLYVGFKVVGGIYLSWLGIRLLISAWRSPASTAAPAGAPDVTAGRAALRGRLTILANPKTGAFVASMFAATLPSRPDSMLGVAVVGTMVLVSAAWYGLVAWSLGFAGPRRVYLRFRRLVESVAGVLFVLFGVKLASGR